MTAYDPSDFSFEIVLIPTTSRMGDAALHNMVTGLEKSLDQKEVALATFLEIEGTFDNGNAFHQMDYMRVGRKIAPKSVNSGRHQ